MTSPEEPQQRPEDPGEPTDPHRSASASDDDPARTESWNVGDQGSTWARPGQGPAAPPPHDASGQTQARGQEPDRAGPGPDPTRAAQAPPAYPPQQRADAPQDRSHPPQDRSYPAPPGPAQPVPSAVGQPAPPPAAFPAQGGPSSAPDKARSGRRHGVAGGIVAVLVILALAVGLLAGLLLAQYLPGVPGAEEDTAPDTSAPDGSAPVLEDASVAEIADAVLPSTVFIQILGAGEAFSGSGFVYNDAGYIVTNAHVVEPALQNGGEVVVVFSDGAEEEAEIVGSTSDYDLAVLRVDRTDLDPVPMGDSDEVRVGDPVVAVGAPLGLEGTVTTGIISAQDRAVRVGPEGDTFINALQTDAAINPGNSGGPLVDSTGSVIGVNTAIAGQPSQSGQAGSIGLGFAIPSTQVTRTAQQIIETGEATYPVIGAILDPTYTGEGVRVHTETANGQEPVTSGGPAAEAGLEPGDVIVAINGDPVTTAEELIVLIRSYAPGDVITLTIRENDQERELQVELGEQASD